MAVPDTDSFNLQDVVTEITPTTDDLVDCFADSISAGFDTAYGTKNDNDLLAFRNYDHSFILTGASLGYSAASAAAACGASTSTFYIDNGGTFLGCTKIYNNSGGTSKASTGYYSNGSVSAFWNSTTEILTGFPSC
jgi:hypothetical protein